MQADNCICRASEIVDWEMGGRTSLREAERIFDKEATSGPGRVLVLVRRGTRGVAFSNALDRCKAYPGLPAPGDARSSECIWGEVHSSVHTLLRADFAAELVDEVALDITRREEAEVRARTAETKRWVRALCKMPSLLASTEARTRYGATAGSLAGGSFGAREAGRAAAPRTACRRRRFYRAR